MSTHTLLVAAPPPGESLPLQFCRQPLSARVGERGEGDAQLTLLGCRLFIPSHSSPELACQPCSLSRRGWGTNPRRQHKSDFFPSMGKPAVCFFPDVHPLTTLQALAAPSPLHVPHIGVTT